MKKMENGFLVDMTSEEEAEYLAIQANMVGQGNSTPPPQLYAIAQILVSGDEITAVNISSRLSAAMRLDVGSYIIFFTEPMPDTSYLALAYDGGEYRCFVRADDKTEDYLILSAVDLTGNPADPANISLEIKRIN